MRGESERAMGVDKDVFPVFIFKEKEDTEITAVIS